MSIQSLCSIHTVQARRLTETTDELGSTYFTVGSAIRTIKCRVIPISEKELVLYMQRDMRATHKFCFAEDPNISNDEVLVYNGRVFRIDSVHDAHELHRFYTLTGFHDPQVDAS